MNIWLYIYRLAWTVLIVALIVAVASFFVPKMRQTQERSHRIAVLEEENRIKEERIRRLRQQQELFANDPDFVERVAREELGKVKPGETVFRFTEPKTNTNHTRH